MNNFDEPVKKAETDAEILDALQGVKLAQDEIRRGACGGMGLAFFRAYYEKLPEEVAHRLTEIDAEAVGHITRATGLNLSGSLLDRFGEKLASDAAFAQVIRAANVYRGRLGYAPLGPDGWPEMHRVTPEEVGVLKLLKLAVEYDGFLNKLEAEGRETYTTGELVDEVVLPIIKL